MFQAQPHSRPISVVKPAAEAVSPWQQYRAGRHDPATPASRKAGAMIRRSAAGLGTQTASLSMSNDAAARRQAAANIPQRGRGYRPA